MTTQRPKPRGLVVSTKDREVVTHGGLHLLVAGQRLLRDTAAMAARDAVIGLALGGPIVHSLFSNHLGCYGSDLVS